MKSNIIQPHERIIVAVDTPDVGRARTLAMNLRGRVGAIKLGLEFLHANGPAGVSSVAMTGQQQLFIDGKFSDIPNTMAGAVGSIMHLLPWLFNVHAMSGSASMEAARKAVDERYAELVQRMEFPKPLILAVTVLTSINEDALHAIGVLGTVEEEVIRLARLAQECGLDGVVCSPLEIEVVRKACGPNFLIVTPGIRPAGSDANDQARLATPTAAIEAGADFLVIGRPITGAADPAAAAIEIADEIARARYCPKD